MVRIIESDSKKLAAKTGKYEILLQFLAFEDHSQICTPKFSSAISSLYKKSIINVIKIRRRIVK